MALSLADNFNFNKAQPNFERDYYEFLHDTVDPITGLTKKGMLDVSKKKLPQMYIAFCKETGKVYLYNKDNEEDPVLGYWREIPSSMSLAEVATSGSYSDLLNRPTIDTALANSTNAIQNKAVHDKFKTVDVNIEVTRLALNAEVYGFRIDKQNSDPETRVEYLYDAVGKTPASMNYTTGLFDYGSWANAWFITGNKPCALKYDGTIDYYLDPNDYTKKADGTASDVSNSEYEGNFMATMPTVWIKRWEDTRYQYVAIASKQIDNDFKAYAHDAGDGTINPMIYLPMFKGVIVDNKLRSIAGVTPQGSTTGSEEQTAAETCGTGWQIWDWSKHCLFTDLLTLISRSTDSQTAFGVGDVNTNDSTLPNYGMLTTGTSSSGQFWGVDDETHHIKVFHVEDLWGNRSERCLGLVLNELSYQCKSVRPYSLSDYTGYTDIEIDAPAGEGFIKNMVANEYGIFVTDITGSNSTYFSDNVKIALGIKILCFGGNCGDNNGKAGMFASHMNFDASYSAYYVGASPCFNPIPIIPHKDEIDAIMS